MILCLARILHAAAPQQHKQTRLKRRMPHPRLRMWHSADAKNTDAGLYLSSDS